MTGYDNTEKCQDCRLKSRAVQTLNEEELLHLEEGCMDIFLKAGDKLFSEGLPNTHVIFLKEGFVKVHMIGPKGPDQILKVSRPGSYLGIPSAMGSKKNHYSATALGEIRACFIKVEIFKHLLVRSGSFASEILNYVCSEEINYFRRFVDQQQKQVNGRLADAILYFSDEIFESHDFTMPLSQSDLAALAGTTRESITRALRDFKSSGMLEVNAKKYSIMDYSLLRKISETG